MLSHYAIKDKDVVEGVEQCGIDYVHLGETKKDAEADRKEEKRSSASLFLEHDRVKRRFS